ncbi:MAG: hypothetical protein ABJM29_18190 [Rhizobiaceae bacterium]
MQKGLGFRGMLHLDDDLETARNAAFVCSLGLVCLLLASCTSASLTSKPESDVGAAAPGPIQIDLATLPGNYGLASYQRAEDRERTLKQAKLACRIPFVINAGANGGVVMHSPGQSSPTEVFLKIDSRNISYLGPRGDAGSPKDQRILFYENGTLITQPMEPRLQSVYGNIVLTPCSQS